jgi:polycystin 1L2
MFTVSFMTGEFASYHEGGYIATLGPTRNNSLAAFKSLTNNSWLDKRTRAIFIDFTLYNPTTYILSDFNLRVGISAAGTVFSSYNVSF